MVSGVFSIVAWQVSHSETTSTTSYQLTGTKSVAEGFKLQLKALEKPQIYSKEHKWPV